MRKPKIGFLSVTCPTHIQSKNETGDAWVNELNIKKIQKVLSENYLDLVVHEKIISSFFELEEAEKLFFNENIDALFIYISTWN